MTALRRLVLAASFLVSVAAAARVDAATSCPIPGFSNAAFANTSFNANGAIDSWDSGSGAYPAGACTDPVSCTDVNACAANIGTNASTIASAPVTSGTCTTSANLSLPIPTMPTSPAPTALGAISGTTTVTGPGNFSATSISESGNNAINFHTQGLGQVVVYVSGNISFSGNGALNNDSLNPANVLIMCTGGSSQTVTLNGNGNAYFTLYCPQAAITLDGGGSGGQIWGAIVGNTITGNGSHAVTIHYDKEVANMTNGSIGCNVEVSRSSPVVATLNGTDYVVQGTTSTTGTKTQLTSANTSTWTFPAYTGHVRARTVASVSSAASSFSSGTILFDASTLMPAANYTTCAAPSTTCRYIFTNTNTTPANGSSWLPTTAVFNDTNASTIGGKIITGLTGTQYQTVLHTIMSASLGGVDRSTVAVIEASNIAGNAARPTIAYFGGTDGMLHAVCASDGTTACPTGSIGKQLWAFMPRVELPLVQYNEQRIDGSVHVADMFGDWTSGTGTGTKSWKTILTFQTGYSNTAHGGVPASYAIDVTDPSAPTVLWEYTTPTPAATNDFGTGLVAAMGPTIVNGLMTNLAVLETNNGGTGGAGVVATAVQMDTGKKVWQFSYAYPTAAAVPAAALPGGAVGADLAGAGNATDYLMGDLYGDLWRLDAQTGASQNGTSTPLFKYTYQAASNKHPIGAVPAIYSDGNNQYVAVAPGGYADQTDSNTAWSLGTHYLVSVKIKATSNPVLDTATASNSATGDLRLKIAIASASNAYSQPTVVGNQMFVTSDTADVNSASYGANQTGTGRVLTVNGINGTATSNSYDTTTSTIYGGASSLVAGHDASGNIVLIGSSEDKQSQVGTSAISAAGTGVATTSSTLGLGTSVDVGSSTKVTRNLWLRTM